MSTYQSTRMRVYVYGVLILMAVSSIVPALAA